MNMNTRIQSLFVALLQRFTMWVLGLGSLYLAASFLMVPSWTFEADGLHRWTPIVGFCTFGFGGAVAGLRLCTLALRPLRFRNR
jgi:hypothetical protein